MSAFTDADFLAFAVLFARYVANSKDHDARIELLIQSRRGGSWGKSSRSMLYALRRGEVAALNAEALRKMATERWGTVEQAAASFLRVGYWWPEGMALSATCRASVAKRYGMTPEQFGLVAALFSDAYVDELVSEVRRAYGQQTNGN